MLAERLTSQCSGPGARVARAPAADRGRSAPKSLWLTDVMMELGPNLGMPHTRAIGAGLFELRVKGQEGLARVFYCTVVGRRIMMLHTFIKKSQKTPTRELEIARRR